MGMGLGNGMHAGTHAAAGQGIAHEVGRPLVVEGFWKASNGLASQTGLDGGQG